MKLFLQSTLFLTATSLSLTGVAAQPQSGANCNISAEVDCRLTDGTNRVCKALENKPFSQCSKNLKVHWTYKYCNLNAQAIYFHKDLFEPLLHNIDVTFATDVTGLEKQFDRTEMHAGECREMTISKVLNTCQKRNTVASLKLEGNLSDKPNGGGNYCYAWAFSKQRIGSPPTNILPPNPNPNPPATQAPVNNEPADISMSLTCKYESQKGSGIFNRDCSGIQTIVPNTPYDCSIPVEYHYTVVNRSTTERAKVQGIVDDEETDNVATAYEVLNPFERYTEVVRGSSIDICARKGVPIHKKAVALAASLPSGIPGSATASLTIPMPAIISQWELVNIGCMYNGMPCSSSMYCIQGEVDFTYNVRNKGYVCNDIQKATVNFGAAATRVLAMDDAHPCSTTGREFCPGDTWALTEKRYVDACNTPPFNYQIVIGFYTTHGTATSIGSWRSGLSSAIQPSPTPPVPAPTAPTHPTTPNLPVCTTEATQLIFMYHGGHSCRHGHSTAHRKRNLRSSSSGKYKSSKDDKSSKEDKKKSSKESKPSSSSSSSSSWFSSSSSSSSSSSHSSSTSTITSTTTSSSSSSSSSMTIISSATTSFCDCNDFAMTSTSDAVKIEVTSKNEKQFYGHHDNHMSGNTFVVTSGDDGSTTTALKSNISVKIYNMHGAVVQTITLNMGGQCLEDILGKPMGSLTLVGWA